MSEVAALPREALTPREMEIVEHLCQGQSNKEIAGALGVSTQTVKNHISRIMAKLGAGSRLEVVVRCLGG